jgi:hypothetical protein
LTVDAVLADEREGVREHIEGDGETPARRTHHEFIFFKFLPINVESRHGSIVLARGKRE